MQFVLHEEFPSEAVSQFAALKLSREQGTFIAEGEKLVVRLLESDIEVISLYLTAEHFEAKRRSVDAHIQTESAEIFVAPKKAMERIVGFTLHQGILASAKIPKEKSLDEIISHSPKPQLFIILDTVVDAENIGAIYRTALAMGATAVIVDDKTTSPWIRRAVRVSMGAVFTLPTITTPDLAKAIHLLSTNEIPTVAAAISDKALPVWNKDLRGSIAIIFGSEGHGIRKEVQEVCSGQIVIPMGKDIGSLNVGVAQGIILYEVMRQRGM